MQGARRERQTWRSARAAAKGTWAACWLFGFGGPAPNVHTPLLVSHRQARALRAARKFHFRCAGCGSPRPKTKSLVARMSASRRSRISRSRCSRATRRASFSMLLALRFSAGVLAWSRSSFGSSWPRMGRMPCVAPLSRLLGVGQFALLLLVTGAGAAPSTYSSTRLEPEQLQLSAAAHGDHVRPNLILGTQEVYGARWVRYNFTSEDSLTEQSTSAVGDGFNQIKIKLAPDTCASYAIAGCTATSLTTLVREPAIAAVFANPAIRWYQFWMTTFANRKPFGVDWDAARIASEKAEVKAFAKVTTPRQKEEELLAQCHALATRRPRSAHACAGAADRPQRDRQGVPCGQLGGRLGAHVGRRLSAGW